jgi:hypothetical protein
MEVGGVLTTLLLPAGNGEEVDEVEGLSEGIEGWSRGIVLDSRLKGGLVSNSPTDGGPLSGVVPKKCLCRLRQLVLALILPHLEEGLEIGWESKISTCRSRARGRRLGIDMPIRGLVARGTPTWRDWGEGETESSARMCASTSGMEITGIEEAVG